MRIAIFSEVFLPKIDGITNRLRNTLSCLVDDGHEVLVFAPAGEIAQLPGVRVVGVPALPFPRYPGLFMGLPDPRIALELARFGPDVVHAVGPACLGVWGILAARAQGHPVVASYHTDLPRYLAGYGLDAISPAIWPLIRRVHNAAHVNLCPSRHTRAELRGKGVRNVGIWRGGVDTRRFHPSRRSREMRGRLSGGRMRQASAPGERPLLLYAGRLAPEKNLETLSWVLQACPEASLALVGDGPAKPQLERVFRGAAVHFAGFLRGEELASAFASADVFVMPSTTETLGFVVLEAMSSGTPVVAADAGGIPDMIRSGENGLLYDPARFDAAVAPVKRLLEDRVLRQRLAASGRETAEGATWQQETRRLIASYQDAIGAASRSEGGRVRDWMPI